MADLWPDLLPEGRALVVVAGLTGVVSVTVAGVAAVLAIGGVL